MLPFTNLVEMYAPYVMTVCAIIGAIVGAVVAGAYYVQETWEIESNEMMNAGPLHFMVKVIFHLVMTLGAAVCGAAVGVVMGGIVGMAIGYLGIILAAFGGIALLVRRRFVHR